MTRPVTETLLEQLRRLFVSHPVVLWLDKDGHYSEFVDELIANEGEPLGVPVLAYRGSYLELMRRMAQVGDAVDPSPLLVHVPGANQDTIKRTPLLELNEQHQLRKGLEALIREAAAGRVKPDEVDAFLAAGDVTLATADAWMARRVSASDDATEIMLRATDPGRLIHDLVTTGPLHRQLAGSQLPAVWHYLATQTGLPDLWPSAERRHEPSSPAELGERKWRLADIAARWVLCVEYVHDLQRKPKSKLLVPAETLARPLIEACRRAAEYLRNHAARDYVRLADDLEDAIIEERDEGEPDELGRIDTFRFEEDRLLVASLRALDACDWQLAEKWADHRLVGKSVWLEIDPARRRAWELVELATKLGRALSESKLSYASARSLDDATERYAEQGAAIDRLHRELEQLAVRELTSTEFPHVELARVAVARVRACWLAWAEQGAGEWSKLCEDESALPSASKQQRHVFEQVVAPLLRAGEKVAFFLIDALRFEMAVQLLELIGEPAGTTVRVMPWLAELPTVTSVGMNALAGVAQRGKLHPKFNDKQQRIDGFDAGGFSVTTRESREARLERASGGVKWFELASFDNETNLNHKISRAKLVVVHGDGIDKAGEKGHGLSHFALELRSVHKAWERLRAAGVRQFVITSDHGFLLRSNDAVDEPLVHGKRNDAGARYAIYPSTAASSRQLAVTLRSLGYEGSDAVLLLPRRLEVYTPGRDRNFVHGGNSPQERVIPVLVVQHRFAAGGEVQHFRVEITDTETLGGGRNVLRARVVRADNQTTLALDNDPIPLELRAVEGQDVLAEPIEVDDATLDAGMISPRVGVPFALVFRLTAQLEQRVRVELVGAGARWRVDPATSQARFNALTPNISGAFPIIPPPVAQDEPPVDESKPVGTPPPAAEPSWIDEFEDPDVRKAMQHIAQHGSISEGDLNHMVGLRKARRFAANFDAHRKRAPFIMEVRQTDKGKVYQKVTDA